MARPGRLRRHEGEVAAFERFFPELLTFVDGLRAPRAERRPAPAWDQGPERGAAPRDCGWPASKGRARPGTSIGTRRR